MDISNYKTVGEFYNGGKAEGYRIPVQMCHGLSNLMEAKGLTFQQAYDYLLKEKKLLLEGKVYIYDLSANKLWLSNSELANRQFNTDNLKESWENLELLAKALKISLPQMILVDEFYQTFLIKPDQKMSLETYRQLIQADWDEGQNTPEALQKWEEKNNQEANG